MCINANTVKNTHCQPYHNQQYGPPAPCRAVVHLVADGAGVPETLITLFEILLGIIAEKGS